MDLMTKKEPDDNDPGAEAMTNWQIDVINVLPDGRIGGLQSQF